MLQGIAKCGLHITNHRKSYGLALITIIALTALSIGIASFGSQDMHRWWTTSDTIKKIGKSGSIIMMAGGGVFAGIGVIGLWQLNRIAKPMASSASTLRASEDAFTSLDSEQIPPSHASSPIEQLPAYVGSIGGPTAANFEIDPCFNQSYLEELLSKEVADALTNSSLCRGGWTAFLKNNEIYFLLITQEDGKNIIQRVFPRVNNSPSLELYLFFENLYEKGAYIDLKQTYTIPEDVHCIEGSYPSIALETIIEALKNYSAEGNHFVLVPSFDRRFYCVRREGKQVIIEPILIVLEDIPNKESTLPGFKRIKMVKLFTKVDY